MIEKDAWNKLRVIDRVKSVVRGTKKTLEYTGVDRHIGTAIGNVTVAAVGLQKMGSDTLDAVTRKSVDEQVREYILMQNHFNDVLALKLDEALKRIEVLERKIGK